MDGSGEESEMKGPLSDLLDEALQEKMNERRRNDACPICGGSEYHEYGCEIGELQNEIARLNELLKPVLRDGYEFCPTCGTAIGVGE